MWKVPMGSKIKQFKVLCTSTPGSSSKVSHGFRV